MKMKLRFCEDEIDFWANRYTAHQTPTEKKAEQELIDLKSKIKAQGHLTRKQLHKVAHWKSYSSAYWIKTNSKDFVKEITGGALAMKNDWAKLLTLTVIVGVREPIASVILHLYDENKYPTLDIHALWSVGFKYPKYSYDEWEEYVLFCRDLADHNKKDMRTLDRALYKYSVSTKK